MIKRLRYYLIDYETDMRHASAMMIMLAILMVILGFMHGQEVREDIAAGRVQTDLSN